jgi:glucokinase
MILAGDVGGTKTRLVLYRDAGGKLEGGEEETFPSKNYGALEEIVQSYLAAHSASIDSACIGVPGPVVNGEARTSNLPWVITESGLSQILGNKRVTLVNDLVATAASLTHLTSENLLVVHEGKPRGPEPVLGVLAPGTGLGQAFVAVENGRERFFASEGGHADFAPVNEVEIELLRYLKTKFERVSCERVLSGPGLVNIYNFLKDTGVAKETPDLARRFREENADLVISSSGLAGTDDICVRALDIFASALGSQAGNLVLAMLATGGMYLGGGIPPKIAAKLTDGITGKAFLSKGRLSGLVRDTSLYIVRDDRAALLGAAHIARARAGG